VDVQSQVKNAGGRAFYNSPQGWTDSLIQEHSAGGINRIQFASDEYFTLLHAHPESREFLAVGRNVRFVMNGELYEIYD